MSSKIVLSFILLIVSAIANARMTVSVGECQRDELKRTRDYSTLDVILFPLNVGVQESSYYSLKLSYVECEYHPAFGSGYTTHVKKFKKFDVGMFENNDDTELVNQHLRARCEEEREILQSELTTCDLNY